MTFESISRNCWETYDSHKDAKALEALANRYIDFISRYKTERETINYVRERLAKAGYSDNPKNNKFMRDLHGKTIFVIFVARRGSLPLSKGMRFIGAHADTPRFDFKQHPMQEQAGVG